MAQRATAIGSIRALRLIFDTQISFSDKELKPLMKSVIKFLFGFSVFLPMAPAFGQTTSLSDEREQAANLAWTAKDYPEIIKIMTEGRAALNSETNTKLRIMQTLALAEYDRNIAAATGRGKLGDPCPILKRANDNLLAFFDDEIIPDTDQDYSAPINFDRAIINYNANEIISLVAEFGCARKIVGSANPSLTGIYSLQGVMETASGLNLMDDGKYQWALTVGGLDLFNEGVWQQLGNIVQLIADPAPPKVKFLTPGDVKPFGSNGKPCRANESDFMNYALQIQPVEIGIGREISLLYSNGLKQIQGITDQNARINVCIIKDDLPIAAELTIFDSDTIYVEQISIKPKADTLQIIEYKSPELYQDGIWAHQMLHIKAGDLIAPQLYPDNAYVKGDINLAN